MGACCSSTSNGVDEDPVKKLNEIIGTTSASSLKDIDITKVPQQRRSMTEVELAASKETIYYRKKKNFARENSLDYNTNPSWQELRGFLDEPLGRFYLQEFASEKKIPRMEALTLTWTLINKIRNIKDEKPIHRMITGKLGAVEDEIGEDAVDAADATAKHGEENTAQLENIDTLFSLSHTLFENHLKPGASMELVFENPERTALKDSVVRELESIIRSALLFANISSGNEDPSASSSDPSAIVVASDDISSTLSGSRKNVAVELDEATKEKLRTMFDPLQRACFREMAEADFSIKFKEHSEYKRYLLKFEKVYNAVTHRDFDFMEILGKGSFGRVIRVRKKTTGKQYALKVMSKKKILSGAENAAQVTIERNVLVMCECRSIVKAYFAFQTTRALFLALDLLDGGNLIHGMEQCGGVFPLEIARFFGAQIIIGLQYLHNLGILYRDLKPLNVMIDHKGNAVLTDMGLCAKYSGAFVPKNASGFSSSGHRLQKRRSLEIVKPNELKCVGTFGFRAPELLDADKTKAGYGPSVDFWALGVTLFYIVEGKTPFKNRSPSILGPQKTPKDIERDLHKHDIKMPSSFEPIFGSLILGLLEKDPGKRLGNDENELRNHPFFKGINWTALEDGKLKSPYKPKTRKYPPDEKPVFDGLAGAMAQFTINDNVLEMFGGEHDLADEYKHVGRRDQKLFRNWGFIPDEELQGEWEKAEKEQAKD